MYLTLCISLCRWTVFHKIALVLRLNGKNLKLVSSLRLKTSLCWNVKPLLSTIYRQTRYHKRELERYCVCHFLSLELNHTYLSVSLSFYVIVCIKNVAVLWDKRKKSESSTLITLVNTINFFYIISSIWFYSWYYFRLVDIILFFKVSFKHVCFKLSECIV